MRHLILVVVALLVLAPAVPTDAAELLWRGRVVWISPDVSSETLFDTGSRVDIDGALAPEVDLVLKFARHWGLELAITAAEHDLEADGGALGGLNLGSTWVAPPTLMLQYHFLPDGPIRPYAGAGVTAITFFNYDLPSELRDIGIAGLEFSDSTGMALGVGADIDINENWFFNVDLKYAGVSTDVELEEQAPPGFIVDSVRVDVDPWIAGVGIGHRF